MWDFAYLLDAKGHVQVLVVSGIVTVFFLAVVLAMTPFLSRRFGCSKTLISTRLLSGVLLTWYLFLTACMTVFFREPAETSHIMLSPFWSYSEAFREAGLKNIFEVINNILFFVPIGVLVPLSLGLRAYKRPMLFTVMFGVIISIIVETTQYFTMRGFCETDDVLHNGVGTIIGYLIYLFAEKLLRCCSHK